MQVPDCLRERLAGNPSVHVDLCRCGCVHLTIGAVSMRLHPDALRDLAAVLGDAQAELELRNATTSARSLTVWS